jgi:ferredoxin/flavodoxin---NADP+ reductase
MVHGRIVLTMFREHTFSNLRNKLSKVIHIRELTDSAYILRFERHNIEFKPGQYVVISLPGNLHKREYSIYSSINAPYLEVLIKEISNGNISKKLKRIKSGEQIEVAGPFGYFLLEEDIIQNTKFLFIASGTGISPFHCFISSYKDLKYKLVHGVRNGIEGYEKYLYKHGHYIQCTSGDHEGNFHGRVTSYLRGNPADPKMHCYLCGNSFMIYEAYDILREQGISNDHLHAEVYF